MNFKEKITKKISQTNRVKVCALISEENNNLLNKSVDSCEFASKELLIEIAIEDFLEKYQVSSEQEDCSTSDFYPVEFCQSK